MARVLIIGASSGIGLETTRVALQSGHFVRAFARSAPDIDIVHPRLERFPGDALQRSDIDRAVQGMDAVIQSLGVKLGDLFRPVRLFSDATRLLVSAMEAHEVKRLICVTGFGAGDSRQSLGLLELVPFRLLVGRAYDDKDVQERLIKNSKLDWTIVRPGLLTGCAPSGRYQVLERRADWRGGIISRADVADFLVRQVDDRSLVGKTPVLVC